MNSKNIKKSLNAKLKNWLESIDDNEIKEIVKNNTIITGGAIVSLLTGEEVNDYDIYFRTREAVLKVAHYYASKFNTTHKTTITINEEKSEDGALIENGKISIFIRSKGVASESPETETITDESEPGVEVEQKEETENRAYHNTSPQEGSCQKRIFTALKIEITSSYK